MGDVIIQYRIFHDGSYSVVARVYSPQKEFYEHPTFINMSKDACMTEMNKLIKNTPSVEEIKKDWLLYGN